LDHALALNDLLQEDNYKSHLSEKKNKNEIRCVSALYSCRIFVLAAFPIILSYFMYIPAHIAHSILRRFS
jgi:hypothetical protein